ncbi:hypothetical protein NDU88_004482 [Pleurodeles waltl]|uniref:Uncharacterized protein n=1 Tax=Pleurodeles waltl TaxID=8319 RepID=A0AAV7MTK7_PLEWA|nr:hypothetical protein NDU88_004482 [Pleurodeles waltl]
MGVNRLESYTEEELRCSTAGIEVQTNSDDEEEQTPETEKENINEEYPLIEFFPMFTVKELHADLQETVQENVWDQTEEAIEHDCLEVTELRTKPKPDIRDTRLEENDQIVFVDGSCLRDGTGTLRAGYAVCTIIGTLEASWLRGVYSAQVAGLVALTRACHVSARLRVTIYTDSQYGFGIVHDFGQLWLQRGFLTSTGTPVRNGDKIKELFYAIQLPEEIAVVKCSAHQKAQDYISLGNGYADQVARFCALNCISFKDKWELMSEEENTCTSFVLKMSDTLEELKTLQSNVDKEQKRLWAKLKCVQRPDEIWVSEEGQMIQPNSLLSQMGRYYHGQTHIGRDAMVRLFKIDWFNPTLAPAAEADCHRCIICQQLNVGKGTVVNVSHIGRAGSPFSRMQLDFIEMPVCGGLKYVMVIVCVFSHRIETYPQRRNNSLTVAKLLLTELLPRFGFPISLESDRGTHFNNEVIKLLCAALNIEHKLHCSYRPEASGLVEQMNGTLKSRIAKMCAATNLKWPDALPLVLMTMRNTPDRQTGLSPPEILMGRAMRLPAVPANALVNITDDMVLDYCKGQADVVRSFSQQVQATTLPPIHEPGHNLRAGDWVVVRKNVRKICLKPRWRGPYQVVATPEPEKEPAEPEVEPELVEDGSITPVRDKSEELQEGAEEPISTDTVGEPSSAEVPPEAEGAEKQTEQVPDQEGEKV